MSVARHIACWLALVCMLSVFSAPALALDPALDVSQYGHTAWKIRDGFVKGLISSFAQTPDGYLWLGTQTGLMRFDGVRNVPWQPPAGTSLPDNRIRALLAARDGTLWIGTRVGLASWNGSKLSIYPQFDGTIVNGLVQDRDGTVWAGGQSVTRNTGLLCAIQGTKTECTGEDGSLGAVIVYEDRTGALWVAGSSAVWRWKPGPPKQYLMPDPVCCELQSLSESATGAILVLTRTGIRQAINDKVESFPLPTSPLAFVGLFRDRDGALWISTRDQGLLHFHQGRTDAFERSDGLSNDAAGKIFEDREGNVWVATLDGLDRFRALPAATYSVRQGLSGSGSSAMADRDGSIWLSTGTGLHRWRDGRLLAYRARSEPPSANASPTSAQESKASEIVVPGLPESEVTSLFQDRRGRIWLGSRLGFGYLENDRFVAVTGVALGGYIDSFAEDSEGNLWVAHRDAGLLRVSADLKIEPVKWPSTGKPSDWWRLAVDPADGGLWLGSLAGGVIHLVHGAVRASYSAADGLGKGMVNDLRVAADGTVWASTDGGLSRIKNGRIATLNGKSGLPCEAVHSSIEDADGSAWVYTACGLVRIARSDLDAWTAAVDRGNAPQTIPMFVLDDSDGVRSFATPGPTSTPHLTKARDGKLWFITSDGVTMVDPRHLPINTLPPPVHVEQIVADHKSYDVSSQIRLPPLVRDLTIDYTALSLVAPEKMQFRYRLEGRDRNWEDAGNRRQAFYTDLAPGDYRFRVIASNNSGVWNEEGATLAFSVAPAYWQTNWFLALCATAFAALIWGAYRLRMQQLAHRRELELELAHANRLSTMGQLTASIAHEVNQPLGATITNAQAALRFMQAQPPDLAEIREALDSIVSAGNRAADIVSRIRRMVKKAPAQAENVALNQEIQGVLAIAHGEAVKHGVSARCELAPDLPIIKADRVELQQVLLNLIINAIEAMSTMSEGPRELVIRSEADDGCGVIVSVSDTGPGLDAAAMERIFQPFYTSKESGLGMGLSICRSIIESHGGKLWASANTPRGAVFQFTLPPKRP